MEYVIVKDSDKEVVEHQHEIVGNSQFEQLPSGSIDIVNWLLNYVRAQAPQVFVAVLFEIVTIDVTWEILLVVC